MLNGPECLQLYISLKLHYSSEKYDFVKYNGKVSKNVDWDKRNDKHFFRKLASHRDPKNLLIANLSTNPSMWIGDIVSPMGDERFRQMIGRWEGISYTFSQDLKKMDFEDILAKDGQHPQLLKLYLQKKICLETLVILNDLVGFGGQWDKNLKDPLWKGMSLIVRRHKTFVKYDKDKMKRLFLERFKSE